MFQQLRELIVWGQLPPGARIAERGVAEQMGVSRTPVRSALHRLQQEGFVTSVGSDGDQRLIVAPMTQSDGEELYFMVGHLEGLAARLAAKMPLPRRRELVARLRATNRELAAAMKARIDVRLVFDLDLEFHRLFVENVVGPRMLALHRAIKPQIERYARAYVGVLLGEGPNLASVREHDTIVAGILRGDPRAAQAAVETNWDNAADRLTRMIAQYGERGSWRTMEARAHTSRRNGRSSRSSSRASKKSAPDG